MLTNDYYFNPERLNLLKKAKDEAAKEIEDYKKLSTEQFKEYRQVVGSTSFVIEDDLKYLPVIFHLDYNRLFCMIDNLTIYNYPQAMYLFSGALFIDGFFLDSILPVLMSTKSVCSARLKRQLKRFKNPALLTLIRSLISCSILLLRSRLTIRSFLFC